MTRSRAAALALVLASVAGCAAAPAARAPAASAPSGVEPSTVEEAQAQLDRAHAELTGASSGKETRDQTTSTPGPSGGAAPSVESQTKPSEAPQQEKKQQDSGCAVACRAIDSMRRATDAICRLAGTDDRRCADARKTLTDDGARVARCGCGS